MNIIWLIYLFLSYYRQFLEDNSSYLFQFYFIQIQNNSIFHALSKSNSTLAKTTNEFE